MTRSEAEASGYRDPSRPIVADVRLHDARLGERPARLTVFSDQSAELAEPGQTPRRFAAGELRLAQRIGGFGPHHVERLELRTRDGRVMLQVPLGALRAGELPRLLEALGGTMEQEVFAATEVVDRHRAHRDRLGPAPPRDEPIELEGHRPVSPSRAPIAVLLAMATLLVAATTAMPRFNALTWTCLASGLLIAGGVGLEGVLRRLFPQRRRLERRGKGVVLVDGRGHETPVDATSLRLGDGDPDECLSLSLAGRDGEPIFAVDGASRNEVQAVRGLLTGARRAVRARVEVPEHEEPLEVPVPDAAESRTRES